MGGGGLGSHPDPEISGEARSPKRFVRPFRPQFGLSKNKGGGGGGGGGGGVRAPPLDPPLNSTEKEYRFLLMTSQISGPCCDSDIKPDRCKKSRPATNFRRL